MVQSIFDKALVYLGCFSIVLSTSLPGSSSVVLAQETQWDRIIRLLQEQDTRNRQIETEVVTLRAEREADRRAQSFSTEEGQQQARQAVTEIEKKIPDALNVLQQVPEEHFPNGLKERMIGCADKLQSVSKDVVDNNLDFSAQDFEGCSPKDVRELLAELDQIKQQTQEAWAQCRDAVLSTGKVSSSSLPSDIFGVARGESKKNENLTENLKELKDQLSDAGDDVNDCADQLSNLYDKALNQENAAAAMAMMMNFAATACAASGGNPYVCGAVFLVAILASLFSDGGGDGDGDGKSDGDGVEGDGTSDVAGVSGGKGGGPGPTPLSPAADPPLEDQPIITGLLNGTWSCGFSGVEWSCTNRSDPQKRFKISADRLVQAEINTDGLRKSNEVLRSILGAGRGSDIAFCTSDANPSTPIGLIAYEGDRYFPMNIVPNPTSPDDPFTVQIRLVDSTRGAQVPGRARDADVQCEAIVK
ncbi:MAG: hypothetical protein AAGL24_27890 [Pseudomonadota bacterium]